MQGQKQVQLQPTITDQFIVKVKLLSNEVYEFSIDPETTTVLTLKEKILEKINVPLDRQRIVFGGKQLVDQNKVTDYVKESGMTVHLIAKMGAQQSTTNTTTSTTTTSNQNQQQPTNNNTQQNATQANQQQQNPFGNIMSMMGGVLGGPQGATISFGNLNDLSGQGLGGLGGLLGSLGLRIPQQPGQQSANTNQNRTSTTGTQQFTQSNNPFQTPPTNSNRPNQQNTQPTSSVNANIPQQQTSTAQNTSSTQWSVSNQPILQLNQTISTLNLPSEPVLDNRHMSLRQQTAQYLRRLQHQYMRMIPQLNRGIQLLNEGRVSHMPEVLRLFQSIDGANLHAEEAIRRLINLPVNQQQQPNTNNNQTNNQQNYTQTQVFGNNQQFSQAMQQQFPQNILNANVEIIIQENDILDGDIDQEPIDLANYTQNINQQAHNQNQSNNQSQSTNQSQRVQSGNTTIHLGPNPLGGLSSLLGSLTGQQSQNNSNQPPQMGQMGGFNLGGLMSMFGQGLGTGVNMNNNLPNQQVQSNNQQAQTATTQRQPNVPQQPSSNSNQQPSQQTSQPMDLSGLASMASMLFNPQPQSSTSNSNSQQPLNASNPLSGGLMGIFSSLQQSGGMGQLMSMSLGQMLQQGTTQPTIYSSIFRSFAGGDLLTCFTSKNFDFLDRKYIQIRQNYLKAIAIAGSQEQLIQKVTQDLSRLLIPRNYMKNQEQCITKAQNIIRTHVRQISRVTMSRGEAKYSQKILQSLKQAFCQAIQKISSQVDPTKLINGQSAQQLVFSNLKSNAIDIMDQFIQGLSGMFYGFIERDLIRVYNQYKEQQKRKKQRSLEQVQSEQQLLQEIQQQSKKDIEYLKNLKHSQFYNPKAE